MAEITEEDIQKMQIDQIIYLPNFVMLKSGGGIENANQFEPIKHPYWEITFKANPIKGKRTFMCFNREIPFEMYRIYKLKTRQEIQLTQDIINMYHRD